MNRLLVLPLTAVALLAGCATTASAAEAPYAPARPFSPASASPSPSPAVTCPSSGVRLEIGDRDAASGLRVMNIDLINCGTRTYRVKGYPQVRALDDKLTPMDITVLKGVTPILGPIPDWSGPPVPVVLRPGQRASTLVAWRDLYDDITNPPVTVPSIEIAPAAHRPTVVLSPEGGLDLGSTGRFAVSPWRPAPTPAKTAQPSQPAPTQTAAQSTELPLL